MAEIGSCSNWERTLEPMVAVRVCSGCHNKLPHRGDLQTTEILSFMLLDPEVQDQGVGRVRHHLKGLGTKSTLLLSSFCGFEQCWLFFGWQLYQSRLCLCPHFLPLLLFLYPDDTSLWIGAHPNWV